MTHDTPSVVDNTAQQRYEIALDGQVAFLAYRRRNDGILLIHTEVPPAFRGRGFGQVLARHALEQARSEGVQAIVKCPFVTRWLERHHEYDDIVAARGPGARDSARQPPREPR